MGGESGRMDTCMWMCANLLPSCPTPLTEVNEAPFEPKKINPLTVSIVSPSICHEVMGPDAMIFVF